MVCLDTDFLIDLSDREERAIKKLEEFEKKGEIVHTTSINVAEFYYGAFRSTDKGKALADADELMEPISVLNLDYTAAKLYGELADRMKSKMVPPLDLLIASIALLNKQSLITRNTKHFDRIPGLQLQSW